jgi:hypothetical protein
MPSSQVAITAGSQGSPDGILQLRARPRPTPASASAPTYAT